MRISDLPRRDIDGVLVPELPIVRKKAPESLLVMAALATTWMEARGEPTETDMRTLFWSLGTILKDVGDMDCDDLDDPRLGRMAKTLAAWHDAVWDAKGEEFIDIWDDAHPNAYRPRLLSTEEKCERRVIEFVEELPEALAAWGHVTHAWADRECFLRMTSGRSGRELLKDETLVQTVADLDGRRKQAAKELADTDFQSVCIGFDASLQASLTNETKASGFIV